MLKEQKDSPRRYMGQVKWFNNKAGYGFITTTLEGANTNDIFAHYTTIQVNNTQYKYLVQGEYVEFSLSTSVSDTHEFQATQITGMNNGRLMCETRQISRRLPREDDVVASPSPVKRIQRPRPPHTDTTPKTPRAPTEKNSDGFENVTRKSEGKVLKKFKKPIEKV